MGTAADHVRARLEPFARAYADTRGLDALAAALGAPVQVIDDVAFGDAAHGPWETLLDPAATPAVLLDWLAQFPGVQLPPGAGEAEKRDRIAQAAGLNEGRTSALVEEIQRTLTGSQTVRLIKRAGGDRWAMTVVTRTAETPDPAATLAAALVQKPVGVKLTHVVSDAPIWAEAARVWSATTATWQAATLADVT